MFSAIERETLLSIDDETREWRVYTASPYFMRRFERAKWKCVKVYKNKQGKIIAKEYTAPRNRIIITKEREKRTFSEEELFVLRERLQEMREKKKKI